MSKSRFLWFILLAATVANSDVFASWPYGWRVGPDGDPRSDILPHPLYDAWVPYRKEYNRPRYVGGWLAQKIEPTSQEAMAWEENHRWGMYRTHHCPTAIPHYYYPKPWEVIPTGARRNASAFSVSEEIVPAVLPSIQQP